MVASFAADNVLMLSVAVQLHLFVAAMTLIVGLVRDARSLDL